jgi:hypothetical protein
MEGRGGQSGIRVRVRVRVRVRMGERGRGAEHRQQLHRQTLRRTQKDRIICWIDPSK